MPELAELSAEERERALSRFRLLAPHLESGRELRTVADGSGVCFRTDDQDAARRARRRTTGGEARPRSMTAAPT